MCFHLDKHCLLGTRYLRSWGCYRSPKGCCCTQLAFSHFDQGTPRFLGLARYYCKFVWHFGILAKPLTELLKKNSLFHWTPAHEQSFQALKQALSSSPVLSLPDFSKPFSIEDDASANGIGTVLTQEGHPLAYMSKALGPRCRGLSTYEKEYLAVIMAVQQWRSYLQVAEFVIYTDQQSLVQLTDQWLHTPWQ